MTAGEVQPGEVILFTPFVRAFGGVERLLLALARALYLEGRPNRIACFEDTVGLASHADWPLCVEQLDAPRNAWAEARSLRRYLSAARDQQGASPLLFDLKSAFYAGLVKLPRFFLHLTDPPSLLPTDISKIAPAARAAYQPFAALPPESWLRTRHAQLVHAANKRGARRAEKALSMTHRIADELDYLYGVKAEIVRPGVPNGPPVVRRAPSATLNLLSVSRLERNKRIDWIIASLRELEAQPQALSEKTNWALHIVGDGSEREALASLSTSYGLADRVIFHGHLSDPELEQLYADADIFLMPAVQGYGLPALEALARNIPVVLHRDSGVAEILHETAWAEIIDSDGHDLREALQAVIDRVEKGKLAVEALPEIPTDEQWASRVADICGWRDAANNIALGAR